MKKRSGTNNPGEPDPEADASAVDGTSLWSDPKRLAALLKQDRFTEVIVLSERMLADFDAQGDQRRLADTFFYRALAQEHQGDHRAAIASFSRANMTYGRLGMRGLAARAMAAGGRLMLASPEEAKQDEGAYFVQEAVCMKLRCDDRSGIGADFVLLSRYALGRKEMSRALGHGRRGLRLSRMQEKWAETVLAMENLIEVYLACRLYRRADKAAEETLTWAQDAKDQKGMAAAKELKDRIALKQRTRGHESKTFMCPCPTNEARPSKGEKPRKFEDCCGPADRDPVEIDWGFCLAPQHGPYRASPDATFNLSLGEYVDRQVSGDAAEGFVVARVHDGWIETSGLSYMANYHLKGARAACEAVCGPLDVGFPIAAILHATCSLEAFMNGLAHVEPNLKAAFRDSRLAVASWADRSEPEIVTKWRTAGSLYCNKGWLDDELLKSMLELIRLRNRLVHFEPTWEAMDEAPDNVPLLSTEDRAEALWWPHGAVGGQTGPWAVSTAERLMAAFRAGLRAESRALRGPEDVIIKMRPRATKHRRPVEVGIPVAG